MDRECFCPMTSSNDWRQKRSGQAGGPRPPGVFWRTHRPPHVGQQWNGCGAGIVISVTETGLAHDTESWYRNIPVLLEESGSSSAAAGDERAREHCGLFGVYGGTNGRRPSSIASCLTTASRQEGAGIVTSDLTRIRIAKGQGLVSEVFARQDWSALSGTLGIGHVRYSTMGSSRAENVQPLVAECVDGMWAVAHNGNLVNAPQLRRMYQGAGANLPDHHGQ